MTRDDHCARCIKCIWLSLIVIWLLFSFCFFYGIERQHICDGDSFTDIVCTDKP